MAQPWTRSGFTQHAHVGDASAVAGQERALFGVPAGLADLAEEHFVQFFEEPDYLDHSLTGYIAEGLDAGDTCIVIATPARRASLERNLESGGHPPAAATHSGQLLVLDAAETLASLQVGGVLDGQRVRDTLGAILERSGERVRVFGEMVALLWAEGRRDDAIALEHLWNDLRSVYAFSLYCAYDLSQIGGADAVEPLARVCTAHSRVVPSESFSRLQNDSDRTWTILQLQHKAGLLQKEVLERQQAEKALRGLQAEMELQLEDLRRLHQTSAFLTGNTETAQVLSEVLAVAMAVHDADMGVVSLYDDDSPDESLRMHAHAGFDESYLREVACVPSGAGSCGTSFAERRRVIVEDTETDPIFAAYRGAARLAGFRSCHSTPLINRDDRILGVLTVHFRARRRPTEREMRLMDLYARMTADNIENARLHEIARRELHERTQLLRRERNAREQAEQANRLKDEFLATVSHELRTPLTAIIGWAHMLRHDDLDAATSARAVETIERAATAQAQLVEDILDVSRIITGRLRLGIEAVPIASIVEAAATSLRPAAEAKDLQLSVMGDADALSVQGDPNRLQQVLWNLLSNAIKFTGKGGRVEVRIDSDGSHARIQVSDTGEGFAAEIAPFLFDRFRQADGSSTRRHGGLGLGLAIVRHLVELHGGAVAAESPGLSRGATFTIRIPLATTSLATAADEIGAVDGAAQSMAAAASLEGIRLLLVDSDPDTLNMLCAMLKEHGATVRTAASAAEAFEILQWYKPAVLISDLALPGEDGITFITRLRAREARGGKVIPAVALTAYARIEDRRRALSAGFHMFVAKPVEPDELVAIIAGLSATADASKLS